MASDAVILHCTGGTDFIVRALAALNDCEILAALGGCVAGIDLAPREELAGIGVYLSDDAPARLNLVRDILRAAQPVCISEERAAVD